MKVSIIVAAAKNNVIGYKNKLPWRLPADLIHFKKLTTGHAIIMGRKTFESIGKALPNRRNIVITRNKNYKKNNIEVVHSIEQALDLVKGEDKVFIIGGEEIYRQTLPVADKIYLTRVMANIKGDSYFPELGREWKEVGRVENKADEVNEHDYVFYEYEKDPLISPRRN